MILRKREADLCNFVFDLQLFAPDDGAGGGTGGADDDAGGAGSAASFSGTLVEKKDPVSGNTIKIPVELESFFGHVISSTRKDAEGKYRPIVEQLEGETAELSDVRAELQKLREASMTAEEKAQENARRKIAEHESTARNEKERADTWEGRFMEVTVKNDIYSAFEDIKLCNAKQTAILLQTEGNAVVKEVLDDDGKPTNSFQTVITLDLTNESTGKLEKVEGTPEALFKRWINEERNLHLQTNSLGSGGGTSTAFRGKNGEDLMKLPAKERLKRAREKME